MMSVLIRNRKGEQIPRGEGKPGEEEAIDWSDAFISQGTPRIAGCHQKLEERQLLVGEVPPPDDCLQKQPILTTSDFELGAFRTVTE